MLFVATMYDIVHVGTKIMSYSDTNCHTFIAQISPSDKEQWINKCYPRDL